MNHDRQPTAPRAVFAKNTSFLPGGALAKSSLVATIGTNHESLALANASKKG
jgi:hypothetical protein